MLEEAIHYVKFLKAQIWLHQNFMLLNPTNPPPLDFLPSSSSTPPVLPHHLNFQDYDTTSYNNYVYSDDGEQEQETMCLDEWYYKY